MKWHSPHKKRNKNKKYNISHKIIVRKIKNGTPISTSKKQINRRRLDVSQIIINPLKDFSHFFEGSPQKIFKPTFDVINNFLKGGKYNISLNYESLDNGKQQAIFPLKINQSNNKGINFEINLPDNFICRGVRFKESYGLDSPLKIYNNRSSFYIERGCVTNFETTFPRRPLTIRGDFKRIQTFEKLEDSAFMRCLIPTNDKDMIFPGYFLDCVPNCILFDIDSLSLHIDDIMGIPMPSTKGHYSKLNINGCNILFYGIEIKNKCCLVIDSIEKIQINDFEKIVYAIRLVYAFFTGRFYNEEKIILTSSKPEFDVIEHFSYVIEPESIITSLQIIDFELFYQFIDKEDNVKIKEEYNKHRKGIKHNFFSSMCNQVLLSEEFKRVLELTTSGGKDNDPYRIT